MVANILKLFFILFFIIVLPIKAENIHTSKKFLEHFKMQEFSFSPNKIYFAFDAYINIHNKPVNHLVLWYIDLKDKKLLPLSNTGAGPSWSPDSKKIVYLFYSSKVPSDIKIFNIKTNKKVSIRSFLPLSSNLIHKPFLNPKWSPTDSNKLAFLVQSKIKWNYTSKNIYLLNIKEKSFIKLTDNDVALPSAWDWSGNGKYIYYASIKPKQQGIYRVNIKTLKRERIISDNNIRYDYIYFFYSSFYSKYIIYSVFAKNSLKLNFYIFKENNKEDIKPRLLFASTKNVQQIFWPPNNQNKVLYAAIYFNKSWKIEKTEIGKVNIKTLQTKKLFNLPTDEYLINWISSHEIIILKNDNQLFEMNLKTGKKKKLFPF